MEVVEQAWCSSTSVSLVPQVIQLRPDSSRSTVSRIAHLYFRPLCVFVARNVKDGLGRRCRFFTFVLWNPRYPVAMGQVSRCPVKARIPLEVVDMKNFLFVGLLMLLGSMCGEALAHGGTKAKSGGVVASAGDLDFELVSRPDGALIYVEDHGKALSTTGASGKLTILAGSAKTEGELKSGGENRLVAAGVKIASGAKVVAVVTLEGKKSLTVRFLVK